MNKKIFKIGYGLLWVGLNFSSPQVVWAAENTSIATSIRLSWESIKKVLHIGSFPSLELNKTLIPQKSLSGCGLQYKKFYLGAQMDGHLPFQNTLEKIRQFDQLNGAHLSSGGIRLGGFLNRKTMIYVKAGFVTQPLQREMISSHPLIPPQAIHKTAFMPSVGFEWQLPDKLSLAAELRASVGRQPHKQGGLSARRSEGAIVFNLRYKLDNDKIARRGL